MDFMNQLSSFVCSVALSVKHACTMIHTALGVMKKILDI